MPQNIAFSENQRAQLFGIGRSASSFGSRNSVGLINTSSINSQNITGSSKVQIASSFDDDPNVKQGFKK
jgi:hypothetical protein